MSFWRKIAGLAVRKIDEAECDQCPPGLPGEDPAFSTAVTALGAKLAKADGEAHAAEYDIFATVFQSEPGSEGNVRRLYQLARQTTRGFESYARRLKKRYGGCPQLLEDVLDGLFHIAASDGAVSGDELAYLERVAELFGLSPLTFRRLEGAAVRGAPGQGPRPGPAQRVHRGGRGEGRGHQCGVRRDPARPQGDAARRRRIADPGWALTPPFSPC